jgi:hypothetical protein
VSVKRSTARSSSILVLLLIAHSPHSICDTFLDAESANPCSSTANLPRERGVYALCSMMKTCGRWLLTKAGGGTAATISICIGPAAPIRSHWRACSIKQSLAFPSRVALPRCESSARAISLKWCSENPALLSSSRASALLKVRICHPI